MHVKEHIYCVLGGHIGAMYQSHTHSHIHMDTYVPYVQLVITGKLQLDYPAGSASSVGSAKSFSWAATAATPKTLLGACAAVAVAVEVDVSSGANVAAAARVAAFASAAFYRLTQFGYIPHIVAALALTRSHTLPLPSPPSLSLLCFSLIFRAKHSNGCASFQRPFQATLAAFG